MTLDYSINLSIDSTKTQSQLNNLATVLDDWTQELIDIGIVACRSIDKNYDEQGRPEKWTPSRAAIKRQGMTLVDTGRLRRSTMIVSGTQPNSSDKIYNLTKNSIEIGTQVPYYKYLHERWKAIMVQDEDIPVYQDIILRRVQNI